MYHHQKYETTPQKEKTSSKYSTVDPDTNSWEQPNLLTLEHSLLYTAYPPSPVETKEQVNFELKSTCTPFIKSGALNASIVQEKYSGALQATEYMWIHFTGN